MGYVYIILEVDVEGFERHKIGFSKNHPDKRAKQLQTGNSNKISVLTFYESVNYKKVEAWMHRKYSSQRTLADNEWFILTNEQVQTFNEDCKEIDARVKVLLASNPFYK